jgi:glutamate synthase (NADPH/NADH) large chain
MNNLRKKVVLQADGQMKTGYDVIMAALMGAEEFGFATAALIVLGCVMMRKCHLNTCPVGVATQDVDLRKRFLGKADYVVNYFRFVAEEVREHMASMGFKTFDEMVGRSDYLEKDETISHWKIKNLDLTDLTSFLPAAKRSPLYKIENQHHKIDHVLDREILIKAEKALTEKENVVIHLPIKNTDRTTGAMLSGRIAKLYGAEGLPENTIKCRFAGSAGQSFGAFLVNGVEFYLEGDTNDYLGKGLSGGRIIVVPPPGSTFNPADNIIIGNTVLYGATRGDIYISGVAGERFAVRNSGANAVIEGVGDHCCEYMTGGRVVVLGKTGRNFAAGMSGGIAYVLDEEGDFDYYCNMGMVELSLVEDLNDQKELLDLIGKHYEYTGSKIAEKVIEKPQEYLSKFIKVIPYEYKKVLQELKLEEIRQKIAQVETDVEISGGI